MKYNLQQNRSRLSFQFCTISGKYFIRISLIILCVLMRTHGYSQTIKHTFTLGDSTFLLDDKPFQMISGELHYPRIPKEAWRHRMKMAKAMGLNTIGTYV